MCVLQVNSFTGTQHLQNNHYPSEKRRSSLEKLKLKMVKNNVLHDFYNNNFSVSSSSFASLYSSFIGNFQVVSNCDNWSYLLSNSFIDICLSSSNGSINTIFTLHISDVIIKI